jgi:4-hydroxy-tetrahydrodipicolinate synthase
MKLKGSLVALLTPFNNGQLDLPAFERLIHWHIAQGTNGIVVCGSTGEGFLLSAEEQRELLTLAVQTTNKRIPVIAAAAGFTAEATLKLCRQAESCGVDAFMVVTPPYLKLTQEALYHFYRILHEGTGLPLLIYNNPGRAGGIFVHDETLYRLAELPRIIGVKDSTNCMLRPVNLRRHLGEDFILLSGEDGTTSAFLAQGGDGAISVTANIAPHLCAQFHRAWQDGHLSLFAKLRNALLPLHQALGLESNPVPVKYAASRLGLCRNELRPPLLPLSQAFCTCIDQVLSDLEITTEAQRP